MEKKSDDLAGGGAAEARGSDGPDPPPPSPLAPPEDRPAVLSLRIKCSSPGVGGGPPAAASAADRTVEAPADSSVSRLKGIVRDALGPGARGRYLRLIARGRLLAPDSARIGGFHLGEGEVVHAVLAAAGVRGGRQAALSRGLPPPGAAGGGAGGGGGASRRQRGGLGVGYDGIVAPVGSDTDGDDDDDDSDGDLEAGTERLGFDRLRSTGLSRDEVSAVRLYFSRQVDRYAEQRRRLAEDDGDGGDGEGEREGGSGSGNTGGNGGDGGSDPRRERLRLEDEWMQLQGPASEFRLNLGVGDHLQGMGVGRRGALFRQDSADGFPPLRTSSLVGTDRDFVWGFILGFFVGFIMLFWVWMPTVPHRQKLGILTGICFHMVLKAVKDNKEDLVDG